MLNGHGNLPVFKSNFWMGIIEQIPGPRSSKDVFNVLACDFMTGQYSVGLFNKLEFRFVAYFKRPVRLQDIDKKVPEAGFEPTSRPLAAIHFCRHQETRLGDPVLFGTCPTFEEFESAAIYGRSISYQPTIYHPDFDHWIPSFISMFMESRRDYEAISLSSEFILNFHLSQVQDPSEGFSLFSDVPSHGVFFDFKPPGVRTRPSSPRRNN